MSRFAGTYAKTKGPGAIEAIGLIPSETSGPRIRLDETWLKKLQVQRSRAGKKATRKR